MVYVDANTIIGTRIIVTLEKGYLIKDSLKKRIWLLEHHFFYDIELIKCYGLLKYQKRQKIGSHIEELREK